MTTGEVWAVVFGAVSAVLIQGAGAALVLRRWRASDVAFLSAFVLAVLVRMGGGVAIVLIALATRIVPAAPFLAAFAVGWVVLEIVADVLYVRLDRLKRLQRPTDGRC